MTTGHGITLDTGALIALERGDKRLRMQMAVAMKFEAPANVPAVVLIEWWRGGTGRQRDVLDGFTVESTTMEIAKLAGLAMAKVKASPVDAAVMASASLRGDVVITSDIADLLKLHHEFFPNVRLIRATGGEVRS